MAKSKQRKKKPQQPTKKKPSNRPAPKATSKQKWLVGVMIFAMLMFVAGGLFKNSNKTKNEVTTTAPTFRHDGNLSFEREGETITSIEIERVVSEEAINQGLMHRKKMQENRGMLFIMPKNELQSFWMRNTYVPLDIIFADSTQMIVTIQKNTKPLSDAPRNSSVPAKYVVEVNAGFSEKFGLKAGDRIKF